MSTLTQLNALRVANNMKPLKAWKESKAKLVAAIAKLTPAKKEKVEGEASILSTVVAELDMNPKVARAKLRREFGKKEDGKWPTTAKAMKEYLETDKRKA